MKSTRLETKPKPVSLMDDATQVNVPDETITLKNDEFDKFIAACEKPKAPSRALRDAVAFTEVNGFK